MSSTTTKPCCATCGTEIPVLKCEGCRQIAQLVISKEQQQHALIQQVNDWECNAMNQIRQTAEESRRLIREHTTDRVSQVEEKLLKLTDQLRLSREKNHFIPQTVSQWQADLVQLSKQLIAPSSITVREISSPLVTDIFVDIPALLPIPNIPPNVKWIQNGVTVAGGNGSGSGLFQLSNPHGLYVEYDQTIYVVDYSNHRIVEWKSGAITGQVVAGGNGGGSQANQLYNPGVVIVDKEKDSLIISDYSSQRVIRWPRRNGTSGETIISGIDSYGLAMDSDGYLYVSDAAKHEVKRWKIGETNGTVVAGGNGAGNRLDQLNGPMSICIDQDHSLYVSDKDNHRVMKWVKGGKEGVVVAGGQGAGSGVTQLNSPRGLVVDQLGTVYVADYSNHRVVRWTKGATQGSVVAGGNGGAAQPNQFNGCMNLFFDRQGNLFVSDYSNDRVQRFNIDPNSGARGEGEGDQLP